MPVPRKIIADRMCRAFTKYRRGTAQELRERRRYTRMLPRMMGMFLVIGPNG